MSFDPDNNSEAAAVAAIVRAANTPVLNVKREGVAVFPNGSVVSIENELLADNPKRRRARVILNEALSFIDYVKRFMVPKQTVIFGTANESGGSFTAVIDYHDQHAEGGLANWGEHTCKLELAATPEWRRWIGKNNTPMGQADFAEFIEDNLQDIINPDGAVLLDLVQFMEGTKSVKFKSGKNLRNGEIKFEYSEEIAEATGARRDGDATLPGRIIVRLRPFVGQEAVDITARLRFAISDSGKVSFRYLLDRPFKVIEAAYNAIGTQIETETKAPVMLGEGSVTPAPTLK